MIGYPGWLRPASAGPLLTLLSLLSVLWTSGAGGIDVMPVDEIAPGMQGTGRTVFQGSTVEDFQVEVVDVIRNSRPQGDLIIFRGLDERLRHAGIIAGMSGSPVYIDGRLVGAVAYAYPYMKDPIGAITPIGEMLDLLDAPGFEDPGRAGDRGSGDRAVFSGEDHGAREARFDAAWESFLSGSRGEEIGGLEAPGPAPAGPGLSLLSLPVSLSGWDPVLAPELARSLERRGFLAAPLSSASGAGEDRGGSAVVEPGQAVSIEMVRGDARLAAVGTLTYVEGDRFVALGHPMLQEGPSDLPFSLAWIHTVMPNLQVSFKMGSPTRPLGRIVHDARAGVSGLLGGIPDMIPVRVTLARTGGAPRTFRYEVIRHPLMSQIFIPWTVTNSFMAAGWAQGDATVESRLTIHLAGGRTVERSDILFTESPGFGLGQEATLPAGILLINPFEEVRIDSLSVQAEYRRDRAEVRLTELRAWPRSLQTGDTLHVEMTMRPHRGDPFTRGTSIRIPDSWAGKRLRLAVGGSNEIVEWDRERAPTKYSPRDLDGLLKLIDRIPTQGELILRIVSEEDGTVVGGEDLPSLPPSLRSATQAEGNWSRVRVTTGALLLEESVGLPFVVTGGEALGLEVQP